MSFWLFLEAEIEVRLEVDPGQVLLMSRLGRLIGSVWRGAGLG